MKAIYEKACTIDINISQATVQIWRIVQHDRG